MAPVNSIVRDLQQLAEDARLVADQLSALPQLTERPGVVAALSGNVREAQALLIGMRDALSEVVVGGADPDRGQVAQHYMDNASAFSEAGVTREEFVDGYDAAKRLDPATTAQTYLTAGRGRR